MNVLHMYLSRWYRWYPDRVYPDNPCRPRRRVKHMVIHTDVHVHWLEWCLDKALCRSIHRDDVISVEIIRDYTVDVEATGAYNRYCIQEGEPVGQQSLTETTQRERTYIEAIYKWYRRFRYVYKTCGHGGVIPLSTPKIAATSFDYRMDRPTRFSIKRDKRQQDDEITVSLIADFYTHNCDRATEKAFWTSLAYNHYDYFHMWSLIIFSNEVTDEYTQKMVLPVRRFYELYLTGFFSTLDDQAVPFVINSLRYGWAMWYALTDSSTSLATILTEQLTAIEASSSLSCQALEEYIRAMLPLYLRFFTYVLPPSDTRVDINEEEIRDVRGFMHGEKEATIRQKLYQDFMFCLRELPQWILRLVHSFCSHQQTQKFNDTNTHLVDLCRDLLQSAHELYENVETIAHGNTKIQLNDDAIVHLQEKYQPPRSLN